MVNLLKMNQTRNCKRLSVLLDVFSKYPQSCLYYTINLNIISLYWNVISLFWNEWVYLHFCSQKVNYLYESLRKVYCCIHNYNFI